MAQLMNLLGSREDRGVAEGPREEEAEMALDLLNRPIDPPEALPLVPLKSLRDEATAKRGGEVHAGIAEGMDPDGQLRVLGETPLRPAARQRTLFAGAFAAISMSAIAGSYLA